MARDRSLDEFLDEDDEPGADAGSEADSTVEPARPTHEWSPDGHPCDRCGEMVTRRWRVDSAGAMVCDDCKEW